ncbi:BTAD domain-containing putative transcriptional regulator [Streptomyces sp. DSM 41527]|uniref:BTAD domain-containing putative transcriptional regulator n=1 Tax=Streptomyces mooreae TaxID=3075523 RepID=A0ABU2T686_9ACTN|nr:BTAD domain-containing putative transcriptional regulator [Streptomyces sp. DSM 41527]MDT0456728.1 BTAD domain-containing putative transcriptional regulator [Streptomyces sp. DSM 41527]
MLGGADDVDELKGRAEASEPDRGDRLRFQVLGPVRAWRGDRPLDLGPAQQRALLAVLLLHGGRPVSLTQLVDALWGERPPPRAVGTLRTYVSRLRGLLEPDRRPRQPARLLVSSSGGYALRVADEALDAAAFEERLVTARRLRGVGDTAGACVQLRDALALPEGMALAGLPGPYAQRQRDRFTELCVTAQEELFGCVVELGRYTDSMAESIAGLRAFAAEHPLRERAQALLMRALHSEGRRAEALAVYAATRRTLVAELGTEPGNELHALYEALRKGAGGNGIGAGAGTEAGEAAGARFRFGSRAGSGSGSGLGATSGPGAGPRSGPGSGPGSVLVVERPRPDRDRSDDHRDRMGSDDHRDRHGSDGSHGLRDRSGSQDCPDRHDCCDSHDRRTGPHRPPRDTSPLGPPPPVPAQLPPDIADFAGRAEAAAHLASALRGAAGGRATVVATLSGLGGVGKTALAVHVAHAVRDRFPDGQLYADLRGTDLAPVDSSAVLTHFLRALGVPKSAVPDGLEQKAALYRSLLADRGVLVVLDNARDSAQVRPLLPGAPGCAVLVTSRVRTLALPGARCVDVEVLDEAEALGLFGAIVGAKRVAAEPEAARELVATCGGLPLAVRIVAARLVSRPGRSMADLVARLSDERRRLDELRVGDLGVEATFRDGYEALGPDLAHAFRAFALCSMPTFCRGAAAALLDTTDDEAEAAVEMLVDAGLVELHGDDRYRYHELVGLFARRLGEAHDSPGEREAAQHRFFDYVLATVLMAGRLTRPQRALPDLLRRPDSPGRALADADAAHEWLGIAHTRLYAAVERALDAAPRLLGAAVDLLTAWSHALSGTARHRDLEPLVRRAVDTARQYGGDAATTRALRLLGAPHHGTDTHGRTDRAPGEGPRSATSPGDPLTSAEAAHELAVVLVAMGRQRAALPLLEAARDRFAALGRGAEVNRVLDRLTHTYVALDRSGEADAEAAPDPEAEAATAATEAAAAAAEAAVTRAAGGEALRGTENGERGHARASPAPGRRCAAAGRTFVAGGGPAVAAVAGVPP